MPIPSLSSYFPKPDNLEPRPVNMPLGMSRMFPGRMNDGIRRSVGMPGQQFRLPGMPENPEMQGGDGWQIPRMGGMPPAPMQPVGPAPGIPQRQPMAQMPSRGAMLGGIPLPGPVQMPQISGNHTGAFPPPVPMPTFGAENRPMPPQRTTADGRIALLGNSVQPRNGAMTPEAANQWADRTYGAQQRLQQAKEAAALQNSRSSIPGDPGAMVPGLQPTTPLYPANSFASDPKWSRLPQHQPMQVEDNGMTQADYHLAKDAGRLAPDANMKNGVIYHPSNTKRETNAQGYEVDGTGRVMDWNNPDHTKNSYHNQQLKGREIRAANAAREFQDRKLALQRDAELRALTPRRRDMGQDWTQSQYRMDNPALFAKGVNPDMLRFYAAMNARQGMSPGIDPQIQMRLDALGQAHERTNGINGIRMQQMEMERHQNQQFMDQKAVESGLMSADEYRRKYGGGQAAPVGAAPAQSGAPPSSVPRGMQGNPYGPGGSW